MSTFITASHVPLFDRLVGLAETSHDGRLLDAGGLRLSLQRDLLRLLNVRNALTIEEYLACDGTVLHYGLPDLLHLSPQSDTDLQTLADVVRHGISLFEPRLQHVQVSAQRDATGPMRARLSIAAAVMVGQQLRRVDFEVDLDDQAELAQEASR